MHRYFWRAINQKNIKRKYLRASSAPEDYTIIKKYEEPSHAVLLLRRINLNVRNNYMMLRIYQKTNFLSNFAVGSLNFVVYFYLAQNQIVNQFNDFWR